MNNPFSFESAAGGIPVSGPVKCRYWHMPTQRGLSRDVILPAEEDFYKFNRDAICYQECMAHPFVRSWDGTKSYGKPYDFGPKIYLGKYYSLQDLKQAEVGVLKWTHRPKPSALIQELSRAKLDGVIVSLQSYHLVKDGEVVDPDNLLD